MEQSERVHNFYIHCVQVYAHIINNKLHCTSQYTMSCIITIEVISVAHAHIRS